MHFFINYERILCAPKSMVTTRRLPSQNAMTPTVPQKHKNGMVSIDRMKEVLATEKGLDMKFFAYMSDTEARHHYSAFVRARCDLKALNEKRKVLLARIRKDTKELTSVEGKLQQLQLKVSYPTPAAKNARDEAVKMIYTCVKQQQYMGLGHASKGGTYAHLTKGSLDKLLQEMVKVAELNRESVFFDVGSGLNIPCLHAVTAYCKCAIGVEIDELRAKQSASLTLQYFKSQGNEPRNHRIAVIHADVTRLQPVNYATHAYMFDLVFPETVHEAVIQWLKQSTFRYVVTFKPAHRTAILRDMLAELGAEEVGRVSGLAFAGSNNHCTAIILRRNDPPSERDTSNSDGLIDSRELVLPFVHGSLEDTVRCYEAFVEAMNLVIEEETSAKRPRKSISRHI